MASPQEPPCQPGQPGFCLHDRPDLCEGILSTIATPQQRTLEIKESTIPGAGSGLFSADDIPAGSEVFRSQPLVNCRHTDSSITYVCDYCLLNTRSTWSTKGRFLTEDDTVPAISACKGCKVALYCSKACQKTAWGRYHKFECKILAQTPDLAPTALALHRILILDKEGRVPEGTWAAVQGLQSSFLKFDEMDEMDDIMMIAIKTGDRIGGVRHDLKVVWSLYCRLLTNCINIILANTEVSVGCSLDLTVAMINHQCEPNAFVFFEGNQVRVRSLRRIPAGGEIFVSYADPRMDVLRRRYVLKTTHFIECQCTRCTRELAEHGHDVLRHARLLQSQNLIDSATYGASVSFFHIAATQAKPEIIKLYNDTLGMIVTTAYPPQGKWPDHIDPLPLARMTLAGMHKTNGELVKALRYGLKGCLFAGSTRRRRGPVWVSDLHELLRILVEIGMEPDDSSDYENDVVPNRLHIRLVTSAYFQELCLAAKRAYGSDAAFTQAVLRWAAVFRNVPNQPPPSHPEFAKRFVESQLKLLDWANIPKSRAVVLSAESDDVLALAEDLKALSTG